MTPLYTALKPAGARAAQSYAVWEAEDVLLIVQMDAGRGDPNISGDLRISRHRLSTGALLDSMLIRGVGHGVNIGLEPMPESRSTPKRCWIWVEAPPMTGADRRAARGSRLVRLSYVPGRELRYKADRFVATDNPDPAQTIIDPWPADTEITACVAGDQLITRRKTPTGRRFAALSLSAAREGRSEVQWDIPSPNLGGRVFQGYTYNPSTSTLHCLTGLPGEAPEITSLHIPTSTTTRTRPGSRWAALYPQGWEPEGMAVINGRVTYGIVRKTPRRQLDIHTLPDPAPATEEATMAYMLDKSVYINAAKNIEACGVRTAFMPDWETNTRPLSIGFGPIYGLLLHGTAGAEDVDADAPTDSYLNFIAHTGQSAEVRGPLSQMFLDAEDGLPLVWFISRGRCNHAGKIARNALGAVKGSTLPLDGNLKPGPDKIDGNINLIAMEVSTGNKLAWVPSEYWAAVIIVAELLRAMDIATPDVLGHKEATTRKPTDPVLDMGRFRRHVAAHLARSRTLDDYLGKTTVPAPDPTKPTLSTTAIAAAQQVIINADATIAKATAQKTAALKVLAPVTAALKEAGMATYSDWQLSLGYTGTEPGGSADGIAGQESLTALMSPTHNVTA